MLDIDSFLKFKSVSEEEWRNASIKGTTWGFQIQVQTRWNPGLTDETITQYEVAVGASVHSDFKTLLRCMNGTDIPAIDVRGSSGEPPRFAPGFTPMSSLHTFRYPEPPSSLAEITRGSCHRLHQLTGLRKQNDRRNIRFNC